MSKQNQPKMTEIEKKVMNKIEKGEAKMKPQSYYLIVGLLSTLAVILLGLMASYFISVMTFWIRIQSAQGPAYGAKNNLINLIGLFPWWALVIGILSLVAMIFMIKKMGTFYKIRLVYLIPSIIILFLVIGFLLSYSSLPGMFNGRRQTTNCLEDNVNCRPSNDRYVNR